MSEIKETVPSEELPVEESLAADAAASAEALPVEESSGTMAAVEATIEKVVETVTDAATGITAAVKPAVESVVEAVTDAAAKAVDTVKSAVEPVVEAVTGSAAAASDSVESAVESAVDTVTESAAKAADEVKAVVEPVVEAVADTATAAVAAAAPQDESASQTVEHTDESGKRVVKTLAVGQEVQGTVKRVSEFGAFVDIGVGRDGLVHISELSVRRVGKVTDVINEGDKVTLWIKKLDRERNRISLTMISPGTRTMRDLNKDDIVTGTVTRILPYGAFIDIGVGRDALLHVREMGERYVAKPEEVVKVGEQVEARIIDIQRRRGRIDLSIKGLREEPEPEPQQQSQSFYQPPQQTQAQRDARYQRSERGRPEPVQETPEPDLPDQFADVEVISPMELAFRKAMEQSGVEFKITKNDKREKRDKRRIREEQEEIYARTLKSGK